MTTSFRGSGCVRRRALEKIALLSDQTSPSSSDASNLERLLRLLPLPKTAVNGHLTNSFNGSGSERSPLTVSELEALLALCKAAPHIRDTRRADQLLQRLSFYISESYTQSFGPLNYSRRFEPCPWEVLTASLTSAILSIGLKHPSLHAKAASALQSYVRGWTRVAYSLSPSQIDGGELDEHVHESEIVEIMMLNASMLGFLSAITDNVYFWKGPERVIMVQSIDSALSSQFMTTLEVALSIVRNSQKRYGHLKDWRKILKQYSAVSRPLGATLLQNSFMEMVLQSALSLILPFDSHVEGITLSRLMEAARLSHPLQLDNVQKETLVSIAVDEMKLLDDDSDFIQLRAPWLQRLYFRIKANTLSTFLCCCLLDHDMAEPEVLMSWLEVTLWDPTQMADEYLADTVLRSMTVLAKISPPLAADLSRLLPRFIVRGGLSPQVVSVAAQSLASVLKLLSSDAVITTLYSLGNVLSASASNTDRGSMAFPFSDEKSKANVSEKSYHQNATGSAISLLINDEDEKSILHSNLVKTIVQIAIIYNDENVVDLARSMLIQKGGTIDQVTDLQIIEQSAKLGIHGSPNDFRALLRIYSTLCHDAVAKKNNGVLEAIMKARLFVATHVSDGSTAYEIFVEHLFNDLISVGEVRKEGQGYQASIDLDYKEIEQLLLPLAHVIERNGEAFKKLCLADDFFKLQRDSWFNLVIHGFDLNSGVGIGSKGVLRTFAKHSNPLVAENWAGELESDVELNVILRRGMDTTLLNSHKHRLSEVFPAYEYEIRSLAYPEAVFLNTAYVLETLRAECGNCTRSLGYFLDPKLRGSIMGNCMVAIATGAMTKYINNAATGASHSFSASFIAEQLAITLIKCCHRVGKVQEVATMCATQMIDNMPSSLCQRRSLFVMLELLDMMWISCLEEEADEFGWRSRFHSTREMITIELSDDYNFRKITLTNFLANAKSWIVKAINIAPLDIKGLLQTYLSDCDEEAVFGHVSLGRSFALEMGSIIPATDHRLTAIEHHDLNINTASDFLAQYTHRQEYRLMKGVSNSAIEWNSPSNQAAFLRNNSERPPEAKHVEKLLLELEKNVAFDKSTAIDQLRITLRKAATLLCTNTHNQNTIIHLLVAIPFSVFTKQAIKLGISLWTGVIKENPLVETRVMIEVAAGWEKTIRQRRGFFSDSFQTPDPFLHKQEFAPSDKSLILKQQNLAHNLLSPHFRILQFLLSRFRASRLDNKQIQRVYYRLIHITLKSMPFATSHPLARQIHFHVVLFGLNVLRFTTILNYAEKWKLKDMILSSALSWFSSAPKWSYGGNRLHVISETHLLADVEGSIRSAESIGINAVGPMASLKAKQDLLLLLLSSEQARLLVWLYPTAQERRNYFSLGQGKLSQEANLLALAETAWAENPSLALHLIFRFPSIFLQNKVRSLLLQLPHKALEDSTSLELLLGSSMPNDVSFQMKYLLFWAPVNPITAVTYFLPAYGNHPLILQYAMRALKSHSVNVTFFYVPQIVQTLRYDSLEYIERYIIEAAKFSQLFAHQIIWNMKANAFKDEDAEVPDPVKPTLDKVMDRLISSFSDLDRQFYEKEFGFFNEVTGISGKLRPYIKRPKPEKKQKIEEELRNIKVEMGVYLPSNPDGIVVGIDRKSGTPLQSHAKAPYKATFRIRKKKDPETLKETDETPSQVMPRSITNDFTYEVWQSAIFKVGDDCRQDVLALQMIAAFRGIFHSVGLDGYVYPYRVTATAPGCGVIDVLPNSVSRDMLGREAVNGLYDYFISKFGSEDSILFQEARLNFVKSMAAYSVICYLLQLKDRHNGNVMIDDAGHILHIDFGFCFDIAPGGVKFERAPFKLTAEMVAVMGGSVDAQPFRWFEELCIKAFLASRLHANHLAHMVLVMLDSGLPCFKPETISHFKDRFVLEKNERDAASFMKDLVRKSYSSYSTRGYDQFQLLTNGIPY